MDTGTIRELEKYLDLLGGIYILDCMPDGFVFDKILLKSEQLMTPKKIINTDEPPSEQMTINKTSVITVLTSGGQKIILDLGKKNYHTKPKSLIGKTIGDTLLFGTVKVTIIEINNIE